MRLSNGKEVGSLLTSYAILLGVVFLYVVSFEAVTCSPIGHTAGPYLPIRNTSSLSSAERRRTLSIRVDASRLGQNLSRDQLLSIGSMLQREMSCNFRRVRGRPLPPNCLDPISSSPTDPPTTTVEVETTTSEAVTTPEEVVPPPAAQKRRKRNALEKDNDISEQNLQSRRKRRNAPSPNNETDCDNLMLVIDEGSDLNGDVTFHFLQPEGCDENDTGIVNVLEDAANVTKYDSRFEEQTNATIVGFGPYSDSYSTYFTTEETTITTVIPTTTADNIVTTTYSTDPTTDEKTTSTYPTTDKETTSTYPTTDEKTTSTYPTTDEKTTSTYPTTDEKTTSTYPTTDEKTTSTYPTTDEITTSAANIATTSYSTYSTTDEIAIITDGLTNVTTSNSTLPPSSLVTYKTWLPILIVLIVLLITVIFVCCYQKGKKQCRRRPPAQAEPTARQSSLPNQAQPRPREAANGSTPPTLPNGPPYILDDKSGWMIPMEQLKNSNNE